MVFIASPNAENCADFQVTGVFGDIAEKTPLPTRICRQIQEFPARRLLDMHDESVHIIGGATILALTAEADGEGVVAGKVNSWQVEGECSRCIGRQLNLPGEAMLSKIVTNCQGGVKWLGKITGRLCSESNKFTFRNGEPMRGESNGGVRRDFGRSYCQGGDRNFKGTRVSSGLDERTVGGGLAAIAEEDDGGQRQGTGPPSAFQCLIECLAESSLAG